MPGECFKVVRAQLLSIQAWTEPQWTYDDWLEVLNKEHTLQQAEKLHSLWNSPAIIAQR